MPTKPSGTRTTIVGHALRPDVCLLCSEGTGQPADIGAASLGTGSPITGTTTWASRAGIGNVLVCDGTRRLGFGTSAFLAGRTRFSVVFAINPSAWAQGGGILSKQAGYLGGNWWSIGLGYQPARGAYAVHFILGKADGTDAAFKAYVTTTGLPTGMQQWRLVYDGSETLAADRVKFYRENVRQATVYMEGTPASYAVPNNASQVIEIGQAVGEYTQSLATLGAGGAVDVNYVAVWDNRVLTEDEGTTLYLNPFVYVTGALPVVSASAPTPVAYEKTVTQTPTAGVFRLTRVASDLTASLTVPVVAAAASTWDIAGAGVDYVAIASPQTIPAGQATLDIPVTPILNPATHDYDKPLDLNIQADAAYEIGASSARVTLKELQYDPMGGIIGARSPKGAMSDGVTVADGLGWWRVEKYGTRWLWVTPYGNYCWLKCVDTVDALNGYYVYYTNQFYGNPPQSYSLPVDQWVPHTLARLKAWGYNCLGPTSSAYMRPIEMAASVFWAAAANPIAISLTPNPVNNGIRSYGVGDLLANISPSAGSYFSALGTGNSGDMLGGSCDAAGTRFSTVQPGFDVAVLDKKNGGDSFGPTKPSTQSMGKWVAWVAPNDTDHIKGWKGSWEIHPGLLGFVANTTFYVNGTDRTPAGQGGGLQTNGTKAHFATIMQQKYGTIDALNAAWGSSYTTWGSSGGWGVGTGFLDEAGQHSWIGGMKACNGNLPDHSATIRADLNQLLTDICNAYGDAIIGSRTAPALGIQPSTGTGHRGFLPNVPMCCEYAQGSAQRDIQWTMWAKNGYDFYFWNTSTYNVPNSGVNETKAATPSVLARFGDRPIMMYLFTEAYADSQFRTTGSTSSEWNYPTQEARGAAYKEFVQWMWNYLDPGTGAYNWCCFDQWGWQDNITEANQGSGGNYGLVDQWNNAYDGQQSTTAARVADRFGVTPQSAPPAYTCGDFITLAREANFWIDRQILQLFINAPPPLPAPPGVTNLPYAPGDTLVSGIGIAGASLQLYVNGAVAAAPVTISGSGTWSVTVVAALLEGQALTATQTTAAGTSTMSAGVTVAPPVPILTGPVRAGSSVTLTGAGETGCTLALMVGGTLRASAAVVGSAWTVTGVALLVGDLLQVRQSNANGTSRLSAVVTVLAALTPSTPVHGAPLELLA